MFRQLLSPTEKRQLELLEHLSNGNGSTMEELSANLEYSIRTIRSDIDHFRRTFQDLFTVQLSKTNRWYIKEKNSLSVLHGINRIYKDNINIQLLKLLLEEKDLSIEEYARNLHSSYSSLFRNLKSVGEFLKEYELDLATKPLHIKGEMRQLRYFYSLLFWGILHKLPEGMTSSYLSSLLGFIEDLKKDEEFEMTIIEGEKLYYFMVISLIFIERGEIDEQFSSPVDIPACLEHKLDALFAVLPFDVPKSERELMGFSILPFYKKKQDLLSQTEKKFVHTLYTSFQSYIQQLSKQTKIELPNKDVFLSQITWRAIQVMYYRGGSFLPETAMIQSMVKTLGPQYFSFSEKAKTLLTEYPLIKKTILNNTDSFIHWMITHWDGFFDEVSRLSPKVDLMIISEYGSAQEHFLWGIIEHEFPFAVSYYPHATFEETGSPPDILITDTYSIEVLNAGIQAKEVIIVKYCSLEAMVQEISEALIQLTKYL